MGRLIDDMSLKDRVSEYALDEDEYHRFCEIIDAEPTAYTTEQLEDEIEREKKEVDFYSECSVWDKTEDYWSEVERRQKYHKERLENLENIKAGGNADLLMDRAKSKSGERIPYDGKWK